MTQVEQLIGDLLLRHNCVIVPTFGGFVTRQTSARVNYEKGTMFPPRKSLLFNRQLVTNDGLLVSECARENNLSFEAAKEIVFKQVKTWEQAMAAGERVELERVGILYLDAEKNICFEQDRFYNLLLASFGLEQVHFLVESDVKKVQAEALSEEIVIESPATVPPKWVEEKSAEVTKAPEAAPIIELRPQTIKVETQEESEVPEILPPVRRRYWRYAVAACILPVAFYSVWIPMKTDVLESGVISLHDFNPFHERQKGQYEKGDEERNYTYENVEHTSIDEQLENDETNKSVMIYEYGPATYIPILVDRTAVAQEQNVAEESVPEEITREEVQQAVEVPVVNPNAMDLIVGCFGIEANAKNLVSKLKSSGFDARIVDFHNGLHRVSAGTGLSQEAMSELRSKAAASGFEGWILK